MGMCPGGPRNGYPIISLISHWLPPPEDNRTGLTKSQSRELWLGHAKDWRSGVMACVKRDGDPKLRCLSAHFYFQLWTVLRGGGMKGYFCMNHREEGILQEKVQIKHHHSNELSNEIIPCMQ